LATSRGVRGLRDLPTLLAILDSIHCLVELQWARTTLYRIVAVHQLLTRLRPNDLFEDDDSVLTQECHRIVGVLLRINRRYIQTSRPFRTIDTVKDWSIESRCGMTDVEPFFSTKGISF
jgi:hypothetical protein